MAILVSEIATVPLNHGQIMTYLLQTKSGVIASTYVDITVMSYLEVKMLTEDRGIEACKRTFIDKESFYFKVLSNKSRSNNVQKSIETCIPTSENGKHLYRKTERKKYKRKCFYQFVIRRRHLLPCFV